MRTKFYKKVTAYGVPEIDFLYHNLSNFTMSFDPTYYRLDESDVAKGPGLVSYKNYGTVRFWWILCLVNGVENILEEPAVGDIWTIPNKLDVYDFFKKWCMR
ncbi:MAG: hypothetical protein ACTSWQ_05925 [Candidatus Thorarchaeota archaeon]